MPHYAILNTNVGLLQWIGEAADEDAAFDALADINEDDMSRDDLRIESLTAEEAVEIKTWWDDAKEAFDTAFNRLRSFNTFYINRFAKEFGAERQSNRASTPVPRL